MQSVIQKKSYGSVKVFWLNKELLDERIRQASLRLKRHRPEVEEVVLFGSLAEGRATAFSDADILIIVKSSQKRFIERGADFAGYFEDIGIEADLFVYTSKEVEQDGAFIKAALSKGRRLISENRDSDHF